MKIKLSVFAVIALAMLVSACSPQTSPPVQPAATMPPTAIATSTTPPMEPPTPTAMPVQPSQGEVKVDVAGFAFSPTTLEVKVGTTVEWMNKDSAAHTVTATDGSFDSGRMSQGASFSFTFPTAGTFAYYCDYHSSMTASITVTP